MTRSSSTGNSTSADASPPAATVGLPISRVLDTPDGLLRSVIDRAPIIIWAVDTDGRFLLFEGQGLVRLGLEPGAVVGRSVFEFEAEVPGFVDCVRRALQGEECTANVPTAKGVYRSWCMPQRGGDGAVVGVRGVATDITDQLRAESEQLLELVLNSMMSGVLVVDPHGETMMINPTGRQIFGVAEGSRFDWRERQWLAGSEQLVPVLLAGHPLSQAIDGQTVRSVSLFVAPQENQRGVWITVNAAPLRGDDGAILGAVMVYRDDSQRRQAELSLERSERRFRRLVETANVVPWEMDFSARQLTYVGPQIVKLLGYPLEDWYRPGFWFDHLHPADRDWVTAVCREAVAREQSDDGDLEYRLISADGSTVWVRDIASLVPREGQSPLLSGFMFDVTERKRTERALQESEARLQAILDGTPALVYLKDTQGRYPFINQAHERLFGHRRDQLVGRHVSTLFPPDRAETLLANDRLVIDADRPIMCEESVPTPEGYRFYLSIKFPLHDADGAVTAVCGISTDITERKRAEEHLLQEQDFLRGLLKAHERDRQLMAYEIHDGLVQDITAGLWHLESLTHALRAVSQEERATFELGTGLLRRSIGEARRVLSGLRPPILDEEGIVMAIQYLVAEQAVPGQLAIRFVHDVQFRRLDSLLEGTVFRIVQESLNNIKRHSGESRAEVRLEQDGYMIRLEIRDWGRGFDLDGVPADRFGLQGIRKRAALFGGRGEIHSAPGQGTRIVVELPLSESDPPAASTG